MHKRLGVAGFLVVGLTMELVSAPAKLYPRPMKPVASTIQTNAVVNKVAAPTPKTAATSKTVTSTQPKTGKQETTAGRVKPPVEPVVAQRSVKPVVPAAVPVASKPSRQTEESAGGVGLTLKAGTLGAGLEATVGANDYLGFRVGANMMNAGTTFERDEGDIKADLEWLTYAGLVDLHVFGGGFRLTGGGLINKNKFKLKADVSESVELDGQEYSLSDLKGQVTFNELAPYLGFGYGNAVGADGHWHFSCDFGVMFQGEPQVEAQATASEPALQPYVDEALSMEVEDIQDDASAFKYYPVISVGVSYRF